MSTRTLSIMTEASLTRDDMACALACDRSTVNRLIAGRPETPPQAKLLDYLARDRGLPHLTAEAFAASLAAGVLPAGGVPAGPVAVPGDGAGSSSSSSCSSSSSPLPASPLPADDALTEVINHGRRGETSTIPGEIAERTPA